MKGLLYWYVWGMLCVLELCIGGELIEIVCGKGLMLLVFG